MSNTLIINSSNVTGTTNSTYQYNFIQGSFVAKDCEIAVGSLTIPYAWFNISTFYSNRSFSLIFPYLATSATLNIVLPDGFYTTADINNYIQNQLIANGLYLVNGSSYVYYVNLSVNTSYYSNQFVFSLVPTTLPSGYTQPPTGFWSATGGNGLPTVSTTPYAVFPASNSVGSVLGFSAGTYPTAPYTINKSSLSNITPVGSTVNGIVMRCNIVNNNIVMPSDILDACPINATFGSNITYNPTFPKWIAIKDGTYNNLTITFQDQNLNTINIKDPNLLLSLLIRKKKNI
jgi:hypothetical protein